jgi:hypothetical protein
MADTRPSPHKRAETRPEVDEETETSPREEQHPALAGDVAVEVEERSADGSTGRGYRKTFVVAGPDEIPHDHPCHEDNRVRTLEEAVQRGLHPKGEARLVSREVVERPRRGMVSTACTYEVDVLPAVIDTEAYTTVTPSSAVTEKTRELVKG